MLDHLLNAVTDDPHGSLIRGTIKPFYYSIVMLFKLSPVTLLVFMFSFINLRKEKTFDAKLLYLVIFLIYMFYTLASQKIDRYFIAFIPYILLMNAVYLAKLTRYKQVLIFSCQGLFTLWVVLTFKPVYSAYYSPLFGGTKRAISIGIYDNSGEYYSQAAQYLNTLDPKATVAIPESFEGFGYFFNGNNQREVNDDTNYYVTSIDSERLTEKHLVNPKCPSMIKSFGPYDAKVVFIYTCN